MAAKDVLQALVRRSDLGNNVCADCPNPNPQWASVSFAVFICLQCAGAHRSYGVHVSFVRSISMDAWSDEQLRRMQLGGNGPFHAFLAAYTPQDQGGYTPGLAPYDKYHCWAASQYRDNLDHVLQDKPWSPSAPPPPTAAANATSPPSSRPPSSQGLRKSRAARGPSAMSRTASASPSPALGADQTQKSANEAYFASLGAANAARPDSLPPNQGGRYAGFGSTPTPTSPSSSDDAGFGGLGLGLTSRNAPSLAELQDDPFGALSKGWTLFAGAVAGAGRALSEHVIQPGVERVQDPQFQSAVRGYVHGAGSVVGKAGEQANAWSREAFGVDVARSIGGVVAGGSRGGGGGGYGRVSQGRGGGEEETSALYHGDDDDDFFAEFVGEGSRPSASASATPASAPARASAKGKDGWDEEWQDF